VDELRFILASRSPRRRQLLVEAGYSFDVAAPLVDEADVVVHLLSPAQQAEALAYLKARSVWQEHQDRYVLGADTIVALGDKVIGKPADRHDARRILGELSGTRHRVITGLALLGPRGRRLIASQTTYVTMRDITPQELDEYIADGEWRDKAGAYAIQETADKFVVKIEGSFSNVVGLPMELLEGMIERIRTESLEGAS